jgi:hypothetical protein
MCQLATYGVIGSKTCQASRTNALKDWLHRARTAGTDRSKFLAERSLSRRLSASFTSARVARPLKDSIKFIQFIIR